MPEKNTLARREENIVSVESERICNECGKEFEPVRKTQAKYCSNACRQKAYRKRKKAKPPKMKDRIRKVIKGVFEC
jgi:NADH pyrophosphatase NudC (nudix superfamily)